MSEAAWEGICGSCWASVLPWTGPACAQCGLPFASAVAAESEAPVCAQCREGQFEFDLARSYGLYRSKLRAVILHLKFRRRERLGKKLGGLLGSLWNSNAENGLAEWPLLVPVPLHPARERERGFNQAELLAQGMCRKVRQANPGLALRVERSCLRRTRATIPQSGLSLQARRENVRGVFSVVSPDQIRNRRVVLVDDVMTTGATLSACASALKGAGAEQVLALTLARTSPQFPDTSSAGPGMSVDDAPAKLT